MRKLFQLIGNTAVAGAAAVLLWSRALAGESGAVLEFAAEAARALAGAEVAILGEVHDNPAHHLNQAAILAALKPRAVVWEMITPAQAAALARAEPGDAAAVARLLDWEISGWPPFALYAPVFASAGGARHYGALVPRAAAGAAVQQGVAAYFGADAARFGLDRPLPAAEQAEREAGQLANHCDALPAEMLPVMVEIQRLRDATLAAAAVQALEETGGPVAVITGNGHARLDQGLAVYLETARPGTRLASLGQAEDGQISGRFDVLLDAPPPQRPDPCLAFHKG